MDTITPPIPANLRTQHPTPADDDQDTTRIAAANEWVLARVTAGGDSPLWDVVPAAVAMLLIITVTGAVLTGLVAALRAVAGYFLG